MSCLVTLVFLVFFSSVQAGDDLSALIDEVFRPQNEVRPDEVKAEHSSDCTCIPYYLCPNNSVITDGNGLIDIRVKDGPCENYLDTCCGAPPLADKITPAPTINVGCGKHNPEGVGFRITGDENGESQFGEFPWMVAVLKEEESDSQKLNVFQCGGALIHPEVVMTAAHCVTSNVKYKIRAGEWDTQTTNEYYPHQDAYVREVVIHPKFYAGALYNDVALLFLSSPVTLAENVNVVCLPRQGEIFDSARCYASGWGKDFFGKEGKYQVIMKKVELPIVPHDKCQDAMRLTRLGPFFNLHKSFVCAGGEPGRDTCKGDGGSPLACPIGNGEKYAQVGIVAWGIGCGEKRTPGIYANVAHVRNWIDATIQQRHLDIKYYQY